MPYLRPATKKIRQTKFLEALKRTGSTRKAAMETLEVGSRGAKDLYNSAGAAGSQMLRRIRPSLLEAYEKAGITTEKLASKNSQLLDDDKSEIQVKALDMAIKVGVGGGYSPEKSLNMNVNATPEDFNKFDKLKEEFEKKLLDEIGNAEA